jgi:hypothetical protein
MKKSNKLQHNTHIEESVNWILDNKANWTQYTNWAREKYHINNRQANDLWKKSWVIISEDFEDSVKQSVNNALLELEQLKEVAMADNDKRIWLEAIKYQNKIRGGEVERQEIKVQGNVTLSWGNELNPDFGQTEIL